MAIPGDNDFVKLAAERLVDWKTAEAVGRQIAGAGPPLSSLDRARLGEDFAEAVSEAEAAVSAFTGLLPGGYSSRPWVMTRAEWLRANLRGFQGVLEPFAKKILGGNPDGPFAPVRRHVLGAQVGGLLGYLGHRVLGQYDLFLPPDDEGLIYFVGANVASLERRNAFDPQQFRLWISLHEVTHRLQFGGVPWLRGYLTGLMQSYLSSVELDPQWLIDALRRTVDEVRRGAVDWRGFGWVFLLMSPDQRDVVRRMQAVMSLLEGHGTFVMNSVSGHRIPDAARFRRTLEERRRRRGLDRLLQKAIGFDVKVRQYEVGELFVARSVALAGMEGFNRVWDDPSNLPTNEEIARPEAWVARVAA